MPRPIQLLFALLLVFVLFCQGCASHLARPALAGGEAALATADHGHDHAQHPHDLQQTSDGGKIAAWFAVGLLLVAVVTIDLLLLPATIHDPFPCCRGVLSICH